MSSRVPSKRSAQRCAPVVASMSCPVMRTRLRRLAHAAFQHVAHAQLAAHLLHVDRPALVGEARVARDDEQPADARQRRDDVLDHAVGEIVLLGVAAQVQERQDGDGGLVGKGQGMCRRFIRAASSGPRCCRSRPTSHLPDVADEPESLAGDCPDQAAAPRRCRRSPCAPH